MTARRDETGRAFVCMPGMMAFGAGQYKAHHIQGSTDLCVSCLDFTKGLRCIKNTMLLCILFAKRVVRDGTEPSKMCYSQPSRTIFIE
jgi:hypothetical protein